MINKQKVFRKKWCFNLETEIMLCENDKLFQQICYYQAVTDVNIGLIDAKERLYQLKALQTEERCDQVINPNKH